MSFQASYACATPRIKGFGDAQETRDGTRFCLGGPGETPTFWRSPGVDETGVDEGSRALPLSPVFLYKPSAFGRVHVNCPMFSTGTSQTTFEESALLQDFNKIEVNPCAGDWVSVSGVLGSDANLQPHGDSVGLQRLPAASPSEGVARLRTNDNKQVEIQTC